MPPSHAIQTQSLVSIRNVSLVYGQGEDATLAVQALSLEISKGEFVAVVGPSGCGKSSLMKLVTGLVPATTGEIYVGGQRVVDPIRGVGMAFQNPTLMPWRTTLNNIMLPFEIVEPHKRAFRRERAKYVDVAERLLTTVGLGKFSNKFPWELSGGMQQRASLCRAVVHQPELMMLDEPFGALDAFTREELWGIMQKLWQEKRFTGVLVTHDLREATYLADRVVVISHRPGRVIYEAKIDLPRPRTLQTTFEPRFIEIVHGLRERISHELTV
jgi:NitT/TauT family transport system ATP-binding protein